MKKIIYIFFLLLSLLFSCQMKRANWDKLNELMEEKFVATWLANREKAVALGARIRPIEPETALKNAKRTLSGSRVSDGFDALAAKNRLYLTLEALVIDKRFTGLFTDEEANEALTRLLEAGYRF